MAYLDYFRDLVPRLDDAGHIISAEDINALQELIRLLQKEAFYRRDEDFIRMLMDVLEHQPDLNSAWIESLGDNSAIDLSNSLGIKFSPEARGVTLVDTALQGYMTSRRHHAASGCVIKKVMLFTVHSIPPNNAVNYEISNNGTDYYPIEANTGRIVEIPTGSSSLYLRIRLQRNNHQHPGPLVGGWAVLYYDSTIDVNLNASLLPEFDPDDLYLPEIPPPQPVQLRHADLLEVGPDDHHPKIHRHNGAVGENDKVSLQAEVVGVLPYEHLPADLHPVTGRLTIIRDPAQNDKVVRVEGASFTARMIHDHDMLVKVIVEQDAVCTVVDLDWGTYDYADGSTETVVVGVDIERTEVGG